MKRIILGALLGMTVLCQPILSEAHDRQSPKAIEVTQKEADELLRIAWCEAGNQGPDGQLYVMSVIINRVNSPEFPNNIHDVIYQPYQFATGGMSNAKPTNETHLALAYLEMGNLIPEIVAFETTENNALDRYFSKAFEYRDHSFYTLSN